MAREIKYGLNTAGNFRLLLFATGSYNCTCSICKSEFLGDKRAQQCLGCAIKLVEEKLTSTNKSSTKFPKIEEVLSELIKLAYGPLTSREENLVMSTHIFIGRKLRT